MATATDELKLANVKIEDAGPSCKRLTIEVGAESVNERFEGSMAELASQAALPGFRPGKAPRKLVERRFGKHLKDDTKQKLVADAYQKAIDDNELKVLGNPILQDEESVELELGKPLSFTVEVEIFPEFEIPSLDELEVRRPLVEADEKLIEQELTNQCNRHGEIEMLTDRDPGPGDFFFGRVTVYNLDDDPFKSIATNPKGVVRWPAEDSDGSGAIGGFKVENLVELLKGKKAGDVITLETEGSENHEIAEIRGKKVKVEFAVEDVGSLIPAEPDELAKQLGCADVDDLRVRMKDALQAQIETEQREVMHRQIARYFLDRVELDLPGRATAAQAERVLQNARFDMLRRNVPEYLIEERLADLREASDEQAKRDLRMHFIMEKLAQDYEISVEEPEVNARIFQIARETGQRPDKVRQQVIDSKSVGVLISQIRHEKAADRVLEQIQIKDVTVDEWNQLMEAEDQVGGNADGDGESAGKKKTSSRKKTGKKKTSKKKSSKKKASEASGEEEEE